jgi:hypothetical protein
MRLLPPLFFLFIDALMAHGRLTRREFLVIGGTIAAGTLAVSPALALSSAQGAPAGPQVIYRLSLRGRRGSKAAKIWNANLRFATMLAADQNRAHPGDHSRIVQIVVSADEYDRLFTSRNSDVADLRALGGPVLVGDCDRNGRVVINELVRGVNIALGQAPVSECTPFDRVTNGRVTVDELVRGVRNALE